MFSASSRDARNTFEAAIARSGEVIALTGGARRLKVSSSGVSIARQSTVKQGPSNLIQTKGYSTTMALSTLNKLLAVRYLRRGDGIESLPASRRRERLFGANGSGRTSSKRAASKCMELLMSSDDEYNPREDTCLKAFIRLLAAQPHAEDSPDTHTNTPHE